MDAAWEDAIKRGDVHCNLKLEEQPSTQGKFLYGRVRQWNDTITL